MKRNLLLGIAGILVVVVAVWAGSTSADGETYQDITDRFFASVAAGNPGEAVSYVFSTNPWMQANAESVQHVINQYTSVAGLLGAYLDNAKLVEHNTGGRLVYQYYFAHYERQPVAMQFMYYKSGDSWMLYSFSFTTEDFDDEIQQLANEELLTGGD